MLQELGIRNFAIIDDLRICFAGGLTVLSGETGAGKSIVINAVNLLLGSRAQSGLIRTGADAAELEALFAVDPGSRTARTMVAQGVDPGEGLMIRRVISRSNQNRIYINDRLSTVQALCAVTEGLASISGQHAHQGLLDEDHHLLVLDRFGGLLPLRRQVAGLYHEIRPLVRELAELEANQHRRHEQLELLQFQLREIDAAAPSVGEDEALALEKKRLQNRARLMQMLQESLEALYSAPGAVVERLTSVGRDMEEAARIDPELSLRATELTQAALVVEDCVDGLRTYLGLIDLDDQRMEEVETRLDVLNRLKRKHGGSMDALLLRREEIVVGLDRVESLAEAMEAIKAELAAKHGELARAAVALSRKRKKAAGELGAKVIVELETLRMENTAFEVIVAPVATDNHPSPYLSVGDLEVTEDGLDRSRFLMAPNIGEALKPLAGIASGGELSRVVLALKAILARTDALETIVFDEVDAGIGGGVAEVVGKKLNALAQHHQIICITHLSQIAKFGDHHYRISKHVSRGRTRTAIEPLGGNDRIEEIARMLSGEAITTATLDHAREIMGAVDRK
ncbi:MAG: DNA repair protein RecN [Desulfobacterales bacterium]|nr:DNA repair protein RecN [Desulfobacterales bacterium]